MKTWLKKNNKNLKKNILVRKRVLMKLKKNRIKRSLEK